MVQQFGGDWTEEKLQRVREYLVAYTTAMRKQPYRLVYLDAFAGTGYREMADDPANAGQMDLFHDLMEGSSERYSMGSARIALEVTPRFDKYAFVERSPAKVIELGQLLSDYPDKTADIVIEPGDANEVLQTWANMDWNAPVDGHRGRRAVLFLDPFGMQVAWETIEAVAKTKAIDVWLLFPLAPVNRLLRRDGRIPESHQRTLDRVFGTQEWRQVFYKSSPRDLFDLSTDLEKASGFDMIVRFVLSRLRQVFPAVAKSPLVLRNNRGSPLYLLCFAVSNPSRKAIELAMRIANHILAK